MDRQPPDLKQRLEEAESTIDALRHQEVDAIVGVQNVLLVRVREAEQQLRAAQQRWELAADAAGLGIFEWCIAEDRAVWDNDRMYDLFGHARDEGPVTLRQLVDDYLHPDDAEMFSAALQESMTPGSTFRMQCRIRRKNDRALRWLEFAGRVAEPRDGCPDHLIGVVADITERRLREEQMRTMMAELNHRVKNTLAVVQSIAKQTARRSPDLASFGRSFEQRLQSIAKAHSLLTRSEWLGASIRAIMHAELNARMGATSQVVVDGPEVMLRPKVAVALHMVVHELTTNACKYGALRTDDGCVEIRWSLQAEGEKQHLHLAWKEQCTQEVPPAKKAGYGSRLIEQLVRYELHGHLDRSYEASGLLCEIRLPLSVGEQARGAACGPFATDGAGPARVLVVEDVLALATELFEQLEEAGYGVLGPAPTLGHAAALLDVERPIAAILDINLDGELIFPLARRLREQGVPFILLTGYDNIDLPPDLRDVPVLNKPVAAGATVAALEAMIGPPPAAASMPCAELPHPKLKSDPR